MPAPFYSAFDVSTLVQFTGTAADARAKLEAELKSRGIDTQQALRNLPQGADGDREAVARLVSLARGNGFCVQIKQGKHGPDFDIVMPAQVNTLQSGHHSS